MYLANGNRKRRGEDLLSSLPDDILTEILSRLPINTAASTSVLSHQWRYLWTRVTRLDFNATDIPPIFFRSILQRLTSPKLNVFNISMSQTLALNLEYDLSKSCIHHHLNCHRTLEQFNPTDKIPNSLFNCQSLVNLELLGYRPSFEHNIQFHLPNLKRLSLRYLTKQPDWLGSLYKSSPLLEHLTLTSLSQLPSSNAFHFLNISFPNLKSLKLSLFVSAEIFIDAPKLTHLKIKGRNVLDYRFQPNHPIALVKACIEFKKAILFFSDRELDGLSTIFRGISTVRNLELSLSKNQFKVLNDSIVYSSPMFLNLVNLEVTLDGYETNRWKDLVGSLQCFPNLDHLSVIIDMGVTRVHQERMECSHWDVPDVVAGHLISKLKTIKVQGFLRNDSGFDLLRYILGNAKELRKLDLKEVGVVGSSGKAERKFCKSLFDLPRKSSSCEIVFSGCFVTSSSKSV